MGPEQGQFDFSRADQKGLVDHCALPSVMLDDGRNVSAAAMKGTLKAIDSYGRGREAWPSVSTLAADSNLSERTVKRALDGLQKLSLLIVTRKRTQFGVSCNHYLIVWTELGLLGEGRSTGLEVVEKRLQAVEVGATITDQSATIVDQSATIVDQSATVAPKALETSMKRQRSVANSSSSVFVEVGGSCMLRSCEVETPVASALPLTWPEVVELLGEVMLGAKRAVHEAQKVGLTTGDVATIVGEYKLNRDRLAGPGAIMYRIRFGCWPADVRTMDEMKMAAKSRLNQSREMYRCAVARDWQKSGKWLSASNAEIEAEVDRRIVARTSLVNAGNLTADNTDGTDKKSSGI